MTSLRRRTALPGPGGAWLSIALLLTVTLTGCVGSDTSNDPDPSESFQVFIAASGNATDAQANLSNVGVTRADTGGTLFLQQEAPDLDLAGLAADGQAQLAATSPDLNANVSKTVLVFNTLTVGNVSLENVRLEVPLDYRAGPGTEATLTLDLADTQRTGAPALDHLVVEQDGTQVASITGRDLQTKDRQAVVPLAQPTILAEAPNATAPSFLINQEISFTVDIEENQSARVREVFWSLSDGSTTAGRDITHAFRTAGPHNVTAIVEGTRGQQVATNLSLDIYWTTDGEGNVGVGTMGSGAINDRDVKDHTLKVPGPWWNGTIRLESSPSGGLCQEGTCAPSNVHVELLDPEGTVVASDTNTSKVKWINVTADDAAGFTGGEWILRVKGDEGAAIGYTYQVEVHYRGLFEPPADE